MLQQAVEIYYIQRLYWSLDLNTAQHLHEQFNKQKMKLYGKNAA
jgi:hypothetical protein